MVDTPFSEEEILDTDIDSDLTPENRDPKDILKILERKKKVFQKNEFLKRRSEKSMEHYLKETELLRMASHFDERDSQFSWENVEEEFPCSKSKKSSED